MIRVHVGCGDKYLPGAINCDRHDLYHPDVVCEAFPLPFPTDYADELWAIHLLEHLKRVDASSALYDWYRVLKPGGLLILELPSLNKIAQNIVNGEKNMRLTVLGIFGDPRDGKPDMMHQWCWSTDELTETLANVGFQAITFMDPIFHKVERDMRCEARKPN